MGNSDTTRKRIYNKKAYSVLKIYCSPARKQALQTLSTLYFRSLSSMVSDCIHYEFSNPGTVAIRHQAEPHGTRSELIQIFLPKNKYQEFRFRAIKRGLSISAYALFCIDNRFRK